MGCLVALQHVELRLRDFAVQYGSGPVFVEVGSWADVVVHFVKRFNCAG